MGEQGGSSADQRATMQAFLRTEVAREDLLTFVNAARAATGQDEFYQAAEEAELSLEFLHDYLRIGYRTLYAQSLALGLNDFNTARVVEELLASGREVSPERRSEEGALIREALRRLPPQRVLALFQRLQARKVNNRRTRAVIKAWLAGRPDPVFDAVKYRRKVKAAARHAHVERLGEVGRFLFRTASRGEPPGARTAKFTHPLLEAVRQARYSAEALYGLPYTVAEGFAAHHRVPRARFLERIAAQMTRGERQRTQRAAAAAGAQIDVSWGQADPTELVRYALSLPAGEELAALEAALPRAATRVAGGWGLGKVAVVLDRSWSMGGSREKRRHPLAVVVAAEALLRAGCRSLSVHWTGVAERAEAAQPRSVNPSSSQDFSPPRPLRFGPHGQTDLATPLLDALAEAPELLLIVSDGVDTDPPGGAEAVLRGWRALDPKGRVRIVHLNPVYDGDALGPRPLWSGIPTVGLRVAEEIPLALALAGAEGEVGSWLAPWVARFLGGSALEAP